MRSPIEVAQDGWNSFSSISEEGPAPQLVWFIAAVITLPISIPLFGTILVAYTLVYGLSSLV